MLVGAVGARAMGGKLGLVEVPVLMGGAAGAVKRLWLGVLVLGVSVGRELDWGRRQQLTGGFLERGRRRGL